MPWHRVVIENNSMAPWSAIGLMKLFILKYKELGSPTDAVVYRGVSAVGEHVYYFSPQAFIIAIAEKVFQTFDVTQCSAKPDLYGFKEIAIRDRVIPT